MGYGLGACPCWPCPLPPWPPPGATGNVVLAQPPPHLLDQQGRGGSWALGRALVGPAAAGGILGQRPGRAGPPGLGRGGLCPRALLQVHRSRDPREAGGTGPRGNPLFPGASAKTHGKRRPGVRSPCCRQEVTAAHVLRAPPGPAWYLVGAGSCLGPGRRARGRPSAPLFHTGLAAGCCGRRGEAGCELGQPAAP